VPYFILYFLIGAPIYYLELALGQFSSRGPATAFIFARGWQGSVEMLVLVLVDSSPMFSGVGIAMIINSILGMLYYNVIIAWALFYFVLSFRATPLWSKCGQWWNTDNCYEPGSTPFYLDSNGTKWNCTAAQLVDSSSFGCVELNFTGKVAATAEFY
jgi:hypothetical protein